MSCRSPYWASCHSLDESFVVHSADKAEKFKFSVLYQVHHSPLYIFVADIEFPPDFQYSSMAPRFKRQELSGISLFLLFMSALHIKDAKHARDQQIYLSFGAQLTATPHGLQHTHSLAWRADPTGYLFYFIIESYRKYAQTKTINNKAPYTRPSLCTVQSFLGSTP